MKPLCIFVILIYIFVTSLIDCVLTSNLNGNLNIVIFFADSNKIPISDFGVKYLHMNEMSLTKSFPDTSGYEHSRSKQCVEKCKQLLHNGLKSLVHFCKNALGMNTAIVTVCNHSSEKCYIKQNESEMQQVENQLRQSRTHKKDSKAKKSRQHKEDTDTIPAITKVKKIGTKEIVLSPEHTEVFKIRIKRKTKSTDNTKETKKTDDNEQDVDYNESTNNFNTFNEFIGSPVSYDKKKHPWDILDIESHVRISFFGDLFKNQEKEILSKQESNLLDIISNKQKDTGLFETVQSVLNNLQENSEAFLMVVRGGHLQEVSDIHSPLIQSLKHIIENTEPENTLLILTGNCPEIKKNDNGVVEINEDIKDLQSVVKIPVYAKGPNCGKLTECSVLYDVPLVVKSILQKTFSDFEMV